MDVEVLKAIDNAVGQNFKCPNTDQSIYYLRKRILELFGRIVSIVSV